MATLFPQLKPDFSPSKTSAPSAQLTPGNTTPFAWATTTKASEPTRPINDPNQGVQGATTTNNGGSGNGVGSDYGATLDAMKKGQITWDDGLLARLSQSANSARDSMLDSIQKRLNETRYQAGQVINNARGTRDYVVDFINKRYPELINRVESQRGDANEDLSTQETDLQTLYDRANAQARRRSESAALTNRMSARAGNRLGSSFYDELVADNQEELGRTLGTSDMERIGKMASIGTQRTRTNRGFDDTVMDLETQKDQATRQAIDEYNKSVQQAEALERAGVLDFGEGVQQAEQNLASRLDSIKQWAQGLTLQKMQLDAQYGSNGTDGSVQAKIAELLGNNNNFITGNANTPAGNATGSYTPMTMATPERTNTPNLLAFGRQKPLTLQDILANVTA